MPVTELVTISLHPPYTIQSDPVSVVFRKGCIQQTRFSSVPVYLFVDVSNASTVYILSGWDDVAHHMRYVESEEVQGTMKEIGEIMTVKAMVHPAINFNTFPKDVSVITVERYTDGEDEVVPQQSMLPTTRWADQGLDEHGEGWKIKVYAEEHIPALLSPRSSFAIMRLVDSYGI